VVIRSSFSRKRMGPVPFPLRRRKMGLLIFLFFFPVFFFFSCVGAGLTSRMVSCSCRGETHGWWGSPFFRLTGRKRATLGLPFWRVPLPSKGKRGEDDSSPPFFSPFPLPVGNVGDLSLLIFISSRDAYVDKSGLSFPPPPRRRRNNKTRRVVRGLSFFLLSRHGES